MENSVFLRDNIREFHLVLRIRTLFLLNTSNWINFILHAFSLRYDSNFIRYSEVSRLLNC